MLKKIHTPRQMYTEDDAGLRQGEFKSWHTNGELHEHSFFINDRREGKCNVWRPSGVLLLECFFCRGKYHGEFRMQNKGAILKHKFYQYDIDITEVITQEFGDINCLTAADSVIIKLRFGIRCLE